MEIGSEFWDVPINKRNVFFSASTQWYLSGRSALQAIIAELKGINTVAMPSWCCDSMVKPFVNAGVEVLFYPVYYKEGLIQDLRLDCDALFIMDYFGFTSSSPKLSGYNGTVIRDITHSVFSNVYSDADYCFGSLRKWCGFWTGGYAWTQDGHKTAVARNDDKDYINYRKIAMEMKACYIQHVDTNNVSKIIDKSYLQIYDNAEKILDHIGIVAAAERDIVAAQHLDVDFIKTQRRNNAQVLLQAFSELSMFPTLGKDDCPLFVPILVRHGQRDALRKFLIQHDIYCPVHWPVSKYHHVDDLTEKIYEDELSLVCDQRYTEKDMLRIVDTVKDFWKEI